MSSSSPPNSVSAVAAEDEDPHGEDEVRLGTEDGDEQQEDDRSSSCSVAGIFNSAGLYRR